MNTLPARTGLAALAVVALTGCGDFARGVQQGYEQSRSSAASAPPTTTVTPAGTSTAKPVVDVKLPEVKGRNGRLVYAELQELGLTDVSYASRDADDKVVINPANWTAVKIEPAAGTTVRSDEPVVVTMTKQ